MIKRVREFVSRYKWWMAAGVVLLALGWMGYLRFVRGIGWAAWTGFAGETLLDWLDLLIIPIFIAVGVWWLDRRQKKTEREFEQARLEKDREIARQRREQDLKIAKEKRHDATLEAYFDRMTALLLEEGLRDSEEGDEVRKIARTWTLSALRRLDGSHNEQVLEFLKDNALILIDSPIINLEGGYLRGTELINVDLSGHDLQSVNLKDGFMLMVGLRKTDLRKAELVNANLVDVDLSEANLQGTNFSISKLNYVFLNDALLQNATLSGAILKRCFLERASLQHADLVGADLWEANLSEADLRGANLRGANLRGADLRGARHLGEADFEGAKLEGAKVLARDVEKLKHAGANLQGVDVPPKKWTWQ